MRRHKAKDSSSSVHSPDTERNLNAISLEYSFEVRLFNMERALMHILPQKRFPSCRSSVWGLFRRVLFRTTFRFSTQELRQSTDDFGAANKVGQGAYGNVYRGILRDGETMESVEFISFPGNEVAIKYLHAGQQAAGFEEEVRPLFFSYLSSSRSWHSKHSLGPNRSWFYAWPSIWVVFFDVFCRSRYFQNSAIKIWSY